MSTTKSFLDKLLEFYGPENTLLSRKERVHIALINEKLSRTDGAPAFVLPDLAIGSAGCGYNRPALQQASITHILVVCGSHVALAFPDDFEYKRIAFEDAASSAMEFEACLLDQCLAYILQILGDGSLNNKLLVHCYQGKSRSAAVVVGFLCQHFDMSFEEAFAKVLLVRPQAEINHGFVSVLRKRYTQNN